jgi:hypothetical protein
MLEFFFFFFQQCRYGLGLQCIESFDHFIIVLVFIPSFRAFQEDVVRDLDDVMRVFVLKYVRVFFFFFQQCRYGFILQCIESFDHFIIVLVFIPSFRAFQEHVVRDHI